MKSFRYLTYFLLGFLLVGCQNIGSQPLPDAEIVYQTDNPEKGRLGFVKADGSNPVVLNERDYVIRPEWSADGSRIYGMIRIQQPLLFGRPAYRDARGGFSECPQWFNYYQVESFADDNKAQVLIASHKTIDEIDIERCETIKVLVNFLDRGELVVMGISYLPEKQWLLYGRENQSVYISTQQIMKLDLLTGVETKLGEGFNPSWSSDGSQIAYVRADGIYIMDADGEHSYRILGFPVLNIEGRSIVIPPFPKWSPDGKWLVYHRCSGSKCDWDSFYSIYKLEISSGKEQQIVQAGIYPDWKWIVP